MVQEVFFSSTLGRAHKDQLERLMFFNPQQGGVKAGIIEAIERYGLPRIVVKDDLLRVNVAGLPEVQTLFALAGRKDEAKLVGVMVYVRIGKETIVLLHVGVKEEYSLSGDQVDSMLMLQMMTKLREIAGRIKGVQSIIMIYGRGVDQRIPVHGFDKSKKSVGSN